MVPIVGYPNPPPPGLNETVEAAGYTLANIGGVWSTSDAAAAAAILAIVASYNPIPYVIALKKQEAADMKEVVEAGGITTSGGIPLDTAPENQLRLLRLSCSTEATPLPATFMVKDRNGVIRSLTRSDARTLGSDINTFFQNCTNGEGLAVAAVTANGLTWEQIMAVDIRSFFPANS